MKNLKSFQKFNEELDIDTYLDIKNLGNKRGDLRGKRLATTANDLINRDAPKLDVYFSNELGDNIRVVAIRIGKTEEGYIIGLNSHPWIINLKETEMGIWEARVERRKAFFDRKGRSAIIELFNKAGIEVENLKNKIPMI